MKENANRIFRNKCKYDLTTSVVRTGRDTFVVGNRYACTWKELTPEQREIVKMKEQPMQSCSDKSKVETTNNTPRKPTQEELEDIFR